MKAPFTISYFKKKSAKLLRNRINVSSNLKRVHRRRSACVPASLVLGVSSKDMRKPVFLFIRESGFENNLREYSVDKSVKKGKVFHFY